MADQNTAGQVNGDAAIQEPSIKYSDGSHYQGEFKNENGKKVRHGQGRMTWIDSNTIYTGSWVDNEMDTTAGGEGTLQWSNGDNYVGQFWKGARHGNGTKTWASNTQYSGQWLNDKKNGHGKLKKVEGGEIKFEYEGEFKDGKEEGQGTK